MIPNQLPLFVDNLLYSVYRVESQAAAYEIHEWLLSNVKMNEWSFNMTTSCYLFCREEDAIRFSLRWS